MNTKKPECNVIGWLDPSFAAAVFAACVEHDEDYSTRRRGRIAADLQWMASAADVCPWRSLVYGFFLLIGSWLLYYDIDKMPKRVWRWLASKVRG